jgi:hypothetical protein
MADCSAALINLEEKTITVRSMVNGDSDWRPATRAEADTAWDAYKKWQEMLKAGKVTRVRVGDIRFISNSDLIISVDDNYSDEVGWRESAFFSIEKKKTDEGPICLLHDLQIMGSPSGPLVPAIPSWNNPEGCIKVSAAELDAALNLTLNGSKHIDICAPYPIIAITGENPDLVALLAPKRFLPEELECLAALESH